MNRITDDRAEGVTIREEWLIIHHSRNVWMYQRAYTLISEFSDLTLCQTYIARREDLQVHNPVESLDRNNWRFGRRSKPL